MADRVDELEARVAELESAVRLLACVLFDVMRRDDSAARVMVGVIRDGFPLQGHLPNGRRES